MDSCETSGIEVSTIFVRSRKWFLWVVVLVDQLKIIC